METGEIAGFAKSLADEERAELFGILLDMADEADPSDSDRDSISEALARRAEVEAGSEELLSEEQFRSGIGR